jgi:hypothetical protein
MKHNKANRLKFDVKQIQRNTRNRLIGMLAISLLPALIIFFGGLLGFPILVKALTGTASISWGTPGDITNLITLSLIIGGGVFVFFEYINDEVHERREHAEASFNIYKELFERLTSEEDTEARRWIIQNIQPCDNPQNMDAWLRQTRDKLSYRPDNWTQEIAPGQMYLKHVLNTFDFVGFVAGNYWSMEEELVQWMSPPVTKVWERIGPFVQDEANKRDEPDYYSSAREFGEYCVNWRRGRYNPAKIIDNAI